jgi:hypothetical protein
MINALCSEVAAMPIPIIAPQSAQPTKAWITIVVICLMFICPFAYQACI